MVGFDRLRVRMELGKRELSENCRRIAGGGNDVPEMTVKGFFYAFLSRDDDNPRRVN